MLSVGPLPRCIVLFTFLNIPTCHPSARAALSAWEAFPHPGKLLPILQSPPAASPHPQEGHSHPPAPTTASTDLGKVPGGYGILYVYASVTQQGHSLTHLWSPAPHTEPRARNPNRDACVLVSSYHEPPCKQPGLTPLSLCGVSSNHVITAAPAGY